jgi:hypothetical protein
MGRAVHRFREGRLWNSSIPGCGRRSRLVAVGAAPLGLAHQPGRLQSQPGHGVAELVAVPLDQMLVKMLHVELAVALLVETLHPRQLGRRRPFRRRLADPPVMRSVDAVLLVARRQRAEIAPRPAEQLAGLLPRQSTLPVALQRLFETKHENLP